MSNQINGAGVITPLDADEKAIDPSLSAAYAGWVSRTYYVEGTPHSNGPAETTHLGVRFDFDFDGATEITILPELLTWGETGDPAPSGQRDSAGQIQLDTIKLTPANLLSDPGSINVPFLCKGLSGIRFRALATGGTAPTLAAKVTAG